VDKKTLTFIGYSPLKSLIYQEKSQESSFIIEGMGFLNKNILDKSTIAL